MSTLAPSLDDLRRWFGKGICVHALRARDGAGEDSFEHALKVTLVGLVLVAGNEFTITSLFVKGAKFEELLGFPLLIVPLVLSWASFIGILLACLRASGVKVKACVASSLTLYVVSGMTPILAVLSHEQLSEGIQLFISRRDPSLNYLGAATVILLRPGEASAFAVARAWLFFLLELGAIVWYVPVNLRRVLIDSSAVPSRGVRITVALLAALVLNAVVSRYYTERLFWLLLGRLLS